jgi:hypothetical protein
MGGGIVGTVDMPGGVAFGPGERAEYTAVTSFAQISAANPNLDGSGTTVSVFEAQLNGSFIRTVTIKATGNTTRGMVRLFIKTTGATRLLLEVEVSAVTKSSNSHAFNKTLPLNYYLRSGDFIYASTENAETFIVTVEALKWLYP